MGLLFYCSFYDEVFDWFKKLKYECYIDLKEVVVFNEFLCEYVGLEDVKEVVQQLQVVIGKKYGNKKLVDVEILELWIINIMENIDNFIMVGDYLMEGVLESVGLVWYVVKLILIVIYSNYEFYKFFGMVFSDISEIMIIVCYYD